MSNATVNSAKDDTSVSESTREHVVQQYSMSSTSYDAPRLEDPKGRLLSRFDQGLFRRMLPKARHGDVVLEVGAGTGRFTLIALESGHSVTASDINESLLAGLRAKVEELGLSDRCRIRQENIYQLSLGDNEADLVYTIHVLPRFLSLDDQRSAMRELARVIKPGGRLLFNYRNRRSLYGLAYKGYACSSGEMKSILRDAGLRVVKIRGKWLLSKKLLVRLPLPVGKLVATVDRLMLPILPSLAWDVFVLAVRE